MQYLDFATVYGRLGSHPGDVSTVQAEALFRCAMKCREGATFVEYVPVGGRTTAILGTAAKNLNGKLYIYESWAGQPPQSQLWFNRALQLYGLREHVVLNPLNGTVPGKVHFALLRFAGGEMVFPDTDFIFALGNTQGFSDRNGYRVIERGDGYAYVSCKNV